MKTNMITILIIIISSISIPTKPAHNSNDPLRQVRQGLDDLLRQRREQFAQDEAEAFARIYQAQGRFIPLDVIERLDPVEQAIAHDHNRRVLSGNK